MFSSYSVTQVDQASGFVTQTILCMPIKNSSEEIIGEGGNINVCLNNRPFYSCVLSYQAFDLE